mmetsp:Transcript_11800/g.37488  ORF Transcript_11800/g.37488 Transcript_11800/m.37488 type:complete len:240 (+) Transcript_11800:135-854(+)
MEEHYGATVRTVYDEAPFYAPGPYEEWLAGACLARAGLAAGHALADLGGGSGAFAARLREEAGARHLTVVDPSPHMLEGAGANPLVDTTACADALAWAEASAPTSQGAGEGPHRFDRILLKEMVHHIHMSDLPRLFGLLREQRLEPGGRLLVVTRPQRGIDYPLWDAAREVWARNQPSEDEIVSNLRDAGFGSVSVHQHAYPHEVAADEWCRLVRTLTLNSQYQILNPVDVPQTLNPKP